MGRNDYFGRMSRGIFPPTNRLTQLTPSHNDPNAPCNRTFQCLSGTARLHSTYVSTMFAAVGGLSPLWPETLYRYQPRRRCKGHFYSRLAPLHTRRLIHGLRRHTPPGRTFRNLPTGRRGPAAGWRPYKAPLALLSTLSHGATIGYKDFDPTHPYVQWCFPPTKAHLCTRSVMPGLSEK